MEHQEQLEKETEEAINAINKKTGRNMPQAIATGAVLVILILACLLISIDLFVYLVVLFMVLALGAARRFRHCGTSYSRGGVVGMFGGDVAVHLLQRTSYRRHDGMRAGVFGGRSDRRQR